MLDIEIRIRAKPANSYHHLTDSATDQAVMPSVRRSEFADRFFLAVMPHSSPFVTVGEDTEDQCVRGHHYGRAADQVRINPDGHQTPARFGGAARRCSHISK